MKNLILLFIALLSFSVFAQVEKRVYDFIVPDNGDFKKAIEMANNRKDQTKRFYIFVRRGDYVIPASTTTTVMGLDEKEYPDPRTDLMASNVSIIGDGMDVTSITNSCPTNTVMTKWGPNCPIEGLRKAYTLRNHGTDNYFQDIKFVNGMADHTGRGEAYEESGDRTIMKRVGLWGYQDTYFSTRSDARYYFEGGVMRGRTDYICGKGDIYFKGVEFRQCEKGGYILAPSVPTKYGYVMRDCIITGEDANIDSTYTFGRPWGEGTPTALWINTTCRIRPSSKAWDEMSGGWPARFAEYGSKDDRGNLLDTRERKSIWHFKDGDAHENNSWLTAKEADMLTVSKVLSGKDGWNPEFLAEDVPVPNNVKIVSGITGEAFLIWDDDDQAMCWAVCKDDVVWKFTTETQISIPNDGSTYSVRAANKMGGLGIAVKAGKKLRVHTIGDSTMADYAEMTTLTRGWGEMLGEFFTNEVEVIDYARGGRSSMSFIHEGRWDKVIAAIVPGDYVLIQFAHNDEHRGGLDGVDYRGTAPWTTYKNCLEKYVADTRATGGIPIFVTPIIRRYFQKDGTISAKGCHNLGDDDTSLNYVKVMKTVAADLHVPVVDMTALTKEYIEKMGDANSKAFIYTPTDNTHTQATGAAVYAGIVAKEMKRMGILSEYVIDNKDFVINPVRLDFGDSFVGDHKVLAFDLIGLSLVPSKGKVTVKAPKGFTLSLSVDGKRQDRISISYSGGKLWKQTLYLHTDSPQFGRANSLLIVSYGKMSRTIPVLANVKAIGQSTAFESPTLTPDVLQNLKSETLGDADVVKISSAEPWPAEIDEVTNRYAEFVIKASTKTLNIQSISCTISGDICYRISYARGKDFYPRTDIAERHISSVSHSDSLPINVTIYPGQELHIRIFPWSKTGGDVNFSVNDFKYNALILE